MNKDLPPKLALFIPCYNETGRLKIIDFQNFISENANFIDFYFVDDGSDDGTSSFLSSHFKSYKNFNLISFKNNSGKGNVLRQGIFRIDLQKYTYLGFIDADLDIPLEQVLKLYESLEQSEYLMAISNRQFSESFNFYRLRSYISVLMVGTANLLLNFDPRIKDTQCGCKMFRSEIVGPCFQPVFVSDWLFDIEVFLRFKKKYPNSRNKIIEVPSKLNKNNSKSALKILAMHKILFRWYPITPQYNERA